MSVIGTAHSQYIHSAAWRKKREERLREDGWQCARCPSIDQLQVHHVTYERLGNEQMADLLTLCDACHAREHGKDPSMPGLLPASWFRDREVALARLEIRQDVVAEAILAHKALADLFACLSVDSERTERIRMQLDEMVSEWLAAHEEDEA